MSIWTKIPRVDDTAFEDPLKLRGADWSTDTWRLLIGVVQDRIYRPFVADIAEKVLGDVIP